MRWKWILGTFVVVILGLIVAAYVIISTYDFNKLKPTVTKAVQDATGRKLTLGGNIELKLGLTPSLVVEDVTFQNASWGSRPDMARVKRFEVQVALLPLVTGDIRIRRLTAIEPDILIETDASGRSNLEFAPSEKPVEKPAQGGKTTIPILFFREVHVERGRLTYIDGPASRTYKIALQDLMAESDEALERIHLKLQGVYQAEPFEMEGTTGFMSAMADPDKAWPVKLSLKAGGALFTVEGTIRDVFNGKGLDLVMTAEGPSIPSLAEMANIRGLPDLGPFKARYKVADPEGVVTFPELSVQVGTVDLVKLDLKGSVKEPLAQKGIDVQFEVQGKDLANLEKLTKKALPVRGPFTVSGHAMDTAPRRFKIEELSASLEKVTLNGSAEIGLDGKRPRVDATLSSEKLDLRPLLSKEKEATGPSRKTAPKRPKKDKVFPDDPLPLEALNLLDGHVQFTAKQMLLPRLALEDMHLGLVLEKGNMTVEPLSARVGGGRVNGRAGLLAGAKVPAVSVMLKADKVDLGRMLKELNEEDILQGKVDLDLDLKGKGRSVAAIMGVLSGKTVLVMGKGKIHNAYIETVGADFSSGISRLLNPSKEARDYTEINCLVSRFDIKNGMATASAMVMDTPNMSVAGEGVVNLKTEELDIALMPSPKKGVGGVSISLAELTKTLKLGGTLAHPALGIDAAGTSLALGKAIGGVVLFGPAGVLASLASETSEKENPCLAAIEAAEKGVKTGEEKEPKEEKGFIEKTTDSISDTFKKLFGK